MISYWINVIKQLEKANKNQADIARSLEISTGTVHNWIKHDRYPPVDRAVVIARLVGSTVEELIDGEVDRTDDLSMHLNLDNDFLNACTRLSMLQEKEKFKIYGMIDAYYHDTLEDSKRESETG